MKASSGFTVIELLVAIAFFGVIATLLFQQQQVMRVIHRDQDRKIAINAMYYNLEEVVRPKLGGYPRVLSTAQLKAMDKSLLRDPSGTLIGEPTSDYRYEPTGCNGSDICSGYTLRADLERESDFVKMNRKV